MIHQAVRVFGKLVSIEQNERGYRTAYVLDGRHVVELAVSKNLNGDLDRMVDSNIVAGCIYSIRWLETTEGRRPAGKLTLVAVENDPAILAEAA
jgi:hypothetical protein